MARWLSWLERRPVTAEVVGSNPIRVVKEAAVETVASIGNSAAVLLKFVKRIYFGILAQLGEHLPYKQRVIGSSPIGPTNYLRRLCQGIICRRGGTGRRTGLKILRD